jgi:ABC-type multidrug transport system fused ATPase/permease subunit
MVIGIIGSLTIQGVQSRSPQGKTLEVLKVLQLSEFSLQAQVAALTVFAVVVLLMKTVLTMVLTKKILNFLSRRGSDTASILVEKLIGEPLTSVQNRDSHDIEYAIGAGLSSITLGVLGLIVTVISDFALVIILLLGVFIIDPLIACITFVLLGGGGVLFYSIMHKKARLLGTTTAHMNLAINGKINEVISLYREIYVRNKRSYYSDEIRKLKIAHSEALAEQTFMPNISKYAVEISVIFSIVIISAVQFLSNNAAGATASLAIFLAATSRLAPAILRIQQSMVQIQINLGVAEPTLLVLRRAETIASVPEDNKVYDEEHVGFVPTAKISNVSFKYPSSSSMVLKNITIDVTEGSFVAIVGPSGSGKTTLVDVLLGLHELGDGQIQISNLSPADAIYRWPGAISYVPQSVRLINGTIRENIVFGFQRDSSQDLHLQEVIKSAILDEFISTLPNGLDTLIGKDGIGMSGGQAQRIGIARALYTNPKFLILDEATSALDSETEIDIARSISLLRGKVTVVAIAHRLSTVQRADKVIYLDAGSKISEGTFDEVRKVVPGFDRQAEILTIDDEGSSN